MLVDATAIHPDKPLDGFTLTNVTGAATAGIKLANIRNAMIRNVKAPIGINNVTGKGLEGATRIDGPKLADAVPPPAQPYTCDEPYCLRTARAISGEMFSASARSIG